MNIGTMEETYLWFTRDPCGVVCMILTHLILIFSNYTVTCCLNNWSSMGYWRYLIIAVFQLFAVLAALSHLKCAFGDPGAVSLPHSQGGGVPLGDARELQHPGDSKPDKAANNRDLEAADANANASKRCCTRGCARGGLLRIFAAVFCPLRVVKNFIGSKRIPTSSTREEEALEEGWSPPICRHCVAPKPLRAHHCSGCKRCIIRMDHHCPWINNCVGFLNQKYFMLFLLYVNLMCCTAFVVLVCRVVTCVDTSGADGPDAFESYAWADSRSVLDPSGYDPIRSTSTSEYHPDPGAELSVAAARRRWSVVHGQHLGRFVEPSVAHNPEAVEGPRRLATADEIAKGILYAAESPVDRWVRERGLGMNSEEQAPQDNEHLSRVSQEGRASQTPFEGSRRRPPKKHFLCDVTLQSAICGAMTFMLSFIFGLFTIVMFFDQLTSILSNTTGVEALKKVKNEKKSSYSLLKEVFGGPFGLCWILPTPVTSFQLKRFTAELQRFPGAPENEDAPEANGPSVASVRSAYDLGASSVPFATRRGRSPHSSEEGYVEGPALLPIGGAAMEGIHPQVLLDADKDQRVSVDHLEWAAHDHAEDPQEPPLSNVFTSPILRQPQPSVYTSGTDAYLGQRFWNDTQAARAAAPAAAKTAAESTKGAEEAPTSMLGSTTPLRPTYSSDHLQLHAPTGAKQ